MNELIWIVPGLIVGFGLGWACAFYVVIRDQLEEIKKIR